MAGYGGGHPAECPKCGSPPWESCFAADDCLRTRDSDMRGDTSYEPKPPLGPNVEDKHGIAPCQFAADPGYWQHSGNQKLYEIIGFAFLWTEEWGVRYQALGETVEHCQPAKRFLSDRNGVRRFTFVPLHAALMPDPTAYRQDAENIDSEYAKIYSQYPQSKPYAGEPVEPKSFLTRFWRWWTGG